MTLLLCVSQQWCRRRLLPSAPRCSLIGLSTRRLEKKENPQTFHGDLSLVDGPSSAAKQSSSVGLTESLPLQELMLGYDVTFGADASEEFSVMPGLQVFLTED